MKKLLTVLILVIFGLSGLLLLSACTRVSQPLPSQPPSTATAAPPPASTITGHGLTVRFAADRAQYILGEPVLITVTAHNRTTEPIVIYDGFDLLDGLIGVQVMAEGDEFRYYSGPFPVSSQLFLTSTLAPGKGRSHSLQMLANRPSGPLMLPYAYAFAKPGNYQVRAVLQGIIPGETLLSNPITVVMVEPLGIDAQIWRLLQTEDTAVFLQTGNARNPALLVKRFAVILEQYPDSFYAPSLRAAIDRYQGTQASPPTPVANVELVPIVREVDGQLYFVRTDADTSARAAATVSEGTLRDIIRVVHIWVDAWNDRDFDGYVQILSRQTKTWQDWQTGSESRLYYKQNQRMQSLFSSTGTVTVEIIGFTIGSDKITVNVIPQFTGQQLIFNSMNFVQDEDGVWRLDSPQ